MLTSGSCPGPLAGPRAAASRSRLFRERWRRSLSWTRAIRSVKCPRRCCHDVWLNRRGDECAAISGSSSAAVLHPRVICSSRSRSPRPNLSAIARFCCPSQPAIPVLKPIRLRGIVAMRSELDSDFPCGAGSPTYVASSPRRNRTLWAPRSSPQASRAKVPTCGRPIGWSTSPSSNARSAWRCSTARAAGSTSTRPSATPWVRTGRDWRRPACSTWPGPRIATPFAPISPGRPPDRTALIIGFGTGGGTRPGVGSTWRRRSTPRWRGEFRSVCSRTSRFAALSLLEGAGIVRICST